jgi:hypothetical protein
MVQACPAVEGKVNAKHELCHPTVNLQPIPKGFCCSGMEGGVKCKSPGVPDTTGGSAIRRITGTVNNRFGEAIVLRPNGTLGCKRCFVGDGGEFEFATTKQAHYKVLQANEVALYVDRFCKAQTAATDARCSDVNGNFLSWMLLDLPSTFSPFSSG